jgi:hypothetical protein
MKIISGRKDETFSQVDISKTLGTKFKLGTEKAEMLSPDKQGLALLCVSLNIRS